MRGLSHVYERIANIDEKTTGMMDASSKDEGAGGGGSLGSLVRIKSMTPIYANKSLTKFATNVYGT